MITISEKKTGLLTWLKRFAAMTVIGCLAFAPVYLPAQDDDASERRNRRAEDSSADRTQRREGRQEQSQQQEAEAERPEATQNTPSSSDDTPSDNGGNNNSGQGNPQGGNRTDTPAAPGRPAEKRRSPQKIQLNINADNLQLIMHPQGDSKSTDHRVTQGEDFVTDIKLINKTEQPIDRMVFVIDYNPSFVSPRIINDSPIADLIDGDPKATVDRNLGQIVYDAKLATPYTVEESTLLFVTWDSNEPVIDSLIRFGRNREIGFTELYYEDLPVLGERQEEGDGTVSMNVTVIPSDPAEALMMQEEPQLYISSNERIGGIELSMIPPPDPVRVGDIFPVEIYLDNAAYSKLDGVSLLMEYDSQYLEVIDDDYDNWITLGYNISDGAYREQFPFNYHLANAVYPTRGIIEYRVATSSPDLFVGVSGVIATIWMKALKPKAQAEIEFIFADRDGLRTTEIKYLGEDVLGDIKKPFDGVESLRFSVLPERYSQRASN